MPFTTVFDVTAQIAADLVGATFPPHPVTSRPPAVSIGVNEANEDEGIVVRIRTDDDDAVAEWAAMGRGGKDERYIVDVWVLSQVAGATWSQMWARLAELTEVVLALFTDADTGAFKKPGGDGDPNPYGVISGMANAERQNQWGTDEGWAGECRVAVRVFARI